MKKIIVAPSILSADFSKLGSEIDLVEKSKTNWLHYDVMDGHFVPNISFGPKILADIRKCTSLVLDVHLMISDPLKYAEVFAKAGADYITFHYEVLDSFELVREAITTIKKLGVKVGLSIKPKTPVDDVIPLLKHLDLLLVMTVEPGFGGQKFMNDCENKISRLREYIDSNSIQCLIEVDGGIDDVTSKICRDKGADVLVAGSYLFGHEDIVERINKMMK